MLGAVAIEDGHGDLPCAVRLASQNIDFGRLHRMAERTDATGGVVRPAMKKRIIRVEASATHLFAQQATSAIAPSVQPRFAKTSATQS